ncbi:riboflavin biosynthesis protein RibD, partial [Corynebacterium frankenforstense]|nr:riboflavin biosynthesis protein RibD [Corynebacterium frankenforstense]
MRPGELEALAAAEAASAAVRGTTSPNPPVGAAIVDVAGDTVGVGATRPAGG